MEKLMISQIYKNNKIFFISTILVTVILSFLDSSIALLFKYALDSAVAGELNNYTSIAGLSILVIGLFVIFGILNIFTFNNYREIAIKNLRKFITKNIFQKRINDFQKKNIGSYLSIYDNDLHIIEDDYVIGQITLISTGFRLFFSAAIMLLLNKQMFIAAILLLIVPGVLLKRKNTEFQNLQQAISHKNESFSILMKEFFSGFVIIKSFSIEPIIKKNISETADLLEEKKSELLKTADKIDLSTAVLGLLGMIGTFLIGMWLVNQKRTTVGTVTAEVQLMTNLTSLIKPITKLATKYMASRGLFKKMSSHINPEDNTFYPINDAEFKHELVLNELSYNYSENKNVLKDITFSFKKNKSYALVGTSGCGKSTILKSILGQLDNYEGSIQLDTQEIKEIEPKQLGKIISSIQQEVFIFDDTFQNNLTIYQDYDEHSIEKVIKQIGMEEFVSENGVDYICGENGNNMSGGQKQRLAIGRALLRNTPILLLDEVTSSLDVKIASNIENLIVSLEDTLRIVVTHLMEESVLRKYDEILFIRDGEIVEHGTFDELMYERNGFFNLFSTFQMEKPLDNDIF